MTQKKRSKVREVHGGPGSVGPTTAYMNAAEHAANADELGNMTPELLDQLKAAAGGVESLPPRDHETPEPTLLSRPEPERVLIGERFISPEAKLVASVGLRREGDSVQLHIEPLWVGRLAKMAERAGSTPQAYLDTLLRRAWCAMPTRDR